MMPARAQLRIIWQMSSMLRSRSGLLPRKMAGISAREISDELIGSGTMSSEMPCDATRSRSFDSASTDHASSIFADGRPLQMLFTPNAAQARRIASESPCCVPTFIFTFGDVVGATMPDFAGACACCADTTASARAADRHAGARQP